MSTEARGRRARSARMPTTRPSPPARRALLPLVLLLLTAMPACARATEPPAPPAGATASQPAQDRFLRLYRGYQADYEPAKNVAELAEWSEVVAVGRLRQIREGRVQGVGRGDPGRTEHLVYVFDVVEKLKGALPGDVAYVEAIKPSLEPATSFDATAPKGAEALLYLRFASPAAPGEPSTAPPDPLPAGARLQWFTTPQGFVMHIGGRVVQPLDQRGPSRPSFQHGDPDPAHLRSWLPPKLKPPR